MEKRSSKDRFLASLKELHLYLRKQEMICFGTTFLSSNHPNYPLSSPYEVRDSQSVVGLLRKRDAQSLALRITEDEEEEPKAQGGKED